jgi:hypothetical protein
MGYMPQTIIAGETIWIAAANTAQSKTDITIDGATPAGGYTLAFQFAAQPTPISVAAVANGANTGWTLEVTAAQTLAWKAGSVAYAAYATLAGRAYAVESGAITVKPSPMAQSAWTAVIAACDAAILTYAGNPNGSLSVDGMSVSYRSLTDLTNLRDYARTMEQRETGNRPLRIIRARFT